MSTPTRNQVSLLEPQQRASALSFASGRLGYLDARGLQTWDLPAWRLSSLPLPDPKGIGANAAGDLVVLYQPEPGNTEIAVLPAGTSRPMSWSGFYPVAFAALSRVGSGAEAKTVLVSSGGGVPSQNQLELNDDGSIGLLDMTQLPSAAVSTWTGLPGGGSAWFNSAELHVDGVDVEPLAHELPEAHRPLTHLAPGPAGEAWALAATQELLRLRLSDGQVLQALPLGDMLPFHLAAAGDVAAVLLVDDRPHDQVQAWTLLVAGPDGVRWQHAVRAPSRPDATFVAVGEGHVAVIADELLAWTLDGAVVGEPVN